MLQMGRNEVSKLVHCASGCLQIGLTTRFAGRAISKSNTTGALKIMTKTGTFFVIALITTAVAVSACRRELPHPNGLGAGDIATQQTVVK